MDFDEADLPATENQLRQLLPCVKYRCPTGALSQHQQHDLGQCSARTNHSSSTRKLERRASLDALAALIAIVVEADLLGRKTVAIKAAGTLHKVLLMLAMELQARGVAVGLIDWLVFNVLPLECLPICISG